MNIAYHIIFLPILMRQGIGDGIGFSSVWLYGRNLTAMCKKRILIYIYQYSTVLNQTPCYRTTLLEYDFRFTYFADYELRHIFLLNIVYTFHIFMVQCQ